MNFAQQSLFGARRGVLHSVAQPTHIVRVLGGGMSRPTRTNVRGVLTHAKSRKEESEEGREEEEDHEEESKEEIGFRISTGAPRRERCSRCSRLRDLELPMTKAKAAASPLWC